jgi:Acetyltransferase (GNAT) domain
MICRRYRPEDKAAVISVLRESIEDWHGDWAEAYWAWKFERNPHGRALIWVGDDAGRIAGCYIWNPVRLNLGGETLLGAQSVDAATHTDYRGRGLFTELARAAAADEEAGELALVYAFPVEAAVRGQVRVGFEPRFTLTPLHRPLLAAPRRKRRDGLEIEEAASFDSRFDAFRSGGGAWQLAVQRDAEYLEWRYHQHPTRSYETFACSEASEFRGYCVLAIESSSRRLRRGYVIDLQVLERSRPAAALLTEEALRRLRARGARVAVSWAGPSGAEQDALASAGFSPRYQAIRRKLTRARPQPPLLVRESETGPLADLLRARADRPQWALVPGDHDSM